MGLRKVSAKKITIPNETAICKVQLVSMVSKLCSRGKMLTEDNQEKDGSWILEKLDLGRLQHYTEEQQQEAKDFLCKSADIFSKTDLDSCNCIILKHYIKLKDYQPFKDVSSVVEH